MSAANTHSRRTYCDCIACIRAETRHRLKVAAWLMLLGPIVTSVIAYHVGKAFL